MKFLKRQKERKRLAKIKSNEKEEDHFKEKSTEAEGMQYKVKSISNEKEGHLRKVRKKGGDDDSKGFNIYY